MRSHIRAPFIGIAGTIGAGKSTLARALGQARGLPAERVQRIFAKADLDGNGAIDFNEFLELQRRKRAIQTWTGGIAAEGG